VHRAVQVASTQHAGVVACTQQKKHNHTHTHAAVSIQTGCYFLVVISIAGVGGEVRLNTNNNH